MAIGNTKLSQVLLLICCLALCWVSCASRREGPPSPQRNQREIGSSERISRQGKDEKSIVQTRGNGRLEVAVRERRMSRETVEDRRSIIRDTERRVGRNALGESRVDRQVTREVEIRKMKLGSERRDGRVNQRESIDDGRIVRESRGEGRVDRASTNDGRARREVGDERRSRSESNAERRRVNDESRKDRRIDREEERRVRSESRDARSRRDTRDDRRVIGGNRESNEERNDSRVKRDSEPRGRVIANPRVDEDLKISQRRGSLAENGEREILHKTRRVESFDLQIIDPPVMFASTETNSLQKRTIIPPLDQLIGQLIITDQENDWNLPKFSSSLFLGIVGLALMVPASGKKIRQFS